jgi:hypothetical protein
MEEAPMSAYQKKSVMKPAKKAGARPGPPADG